MKLTLNDYCILVKRLFSNMNWVITNKWLDPTIHYLHLIFSRRALHSVRTEMLTLYRTVFTSEMEVRNVFSCCSGFQNRATRRTLNVYENCMQNSLKLKTCYILIFGSIEKSPTSPHSEVGRVNALVNGSG